jgi:hypothetical protein
MDGARRSVPVPANPGLVAGKILETPTMRSTSGPMLEIELPDGIRIRLREDASFETIQRVIQAGNSVQIQGTDERTAVRSC